jgi:guanylate kinase
MNSRKGKFIILTGPSAAGKTRIAKNLLELFPNTTRLITTTTRAKRPGEINGVHYHFVSEKHFRESDARGEFMKTAKTYGNFYGSSHVELKKLLLKHPIVFAVIDVKGSREIKLKIPESIVMFIAPGSIDDIEQRLKKRSGSYDEFKRRMVEAKVEMKSMEKFDHLIFNIEGKFENTIEKILSYIETIIS